MRSGRDRPVTCRIALGADRVNVTNADRIFGLNAGSIWSFIEYKGRAIRAHPVRRFSGVSPAQDKITTQGLKYRVAHNRTSVKRLW